MRLVTIFYGLFLWLERLVSGQALLASGLSEDSDFTGRGLEAWDGSLQISTNLRMVYGK